MRRPVAKTYLDEVDLVLGAQGLDELRVGRLIAAGSEDAKMCLSCRKKSKWVKYTWAHPLTRSAIV